MRSRAVHSCYIDCILWKVWCLMNGTGKWTELFRAWTSQMKPPYKAHSVSPATRRCCCCKHPLAEARGSIYLRSHLHQPQVTPSAVRKSNQPGREISRGYNNHTEASETNRFQATLLHQKGENFSHPFSSLRNSRQWSLALVEVCWTKKCSRWGKSFHPLGVW